MPGSREAGDRAEAVLVWDGSFAGFLCALSRAALIRRSGSPLPRLRPRDAAPELFEASLDVQTDPDHALRIWNRIQAVAGERTALDCQAALLSGLPGAAEAVARLVLRIAEAARSRGREGASERTGSPGADAGLPGGLGDPDGLLVMEASRKARAEAHKICGLVRFSELEDGSWYASIHPGCDILPLIADHFSSRYADMAFAIHDLGRGKALLHRPGSPWRIAAGFSIGSGGALPLSEREREIQAGWRLYFTSVAIEERKNPRLQASHMPRKYWPLLPEMRTMVP